MKNIFTLIAVLFSVTTFAAPVPKASKISISNNDRSVTQVKIDGKMYNVNNTFVMDNIRTGNHTITIYKSVVTGFRKTSAVIYNSSMYVAPARLINININRNGKVAVKTVTDNSYNKYGRDDHNKGNGRDNRNDSRNNNYGRH
jgi:hypothetical protein